MVSPITPTSPPGVVKPTKKDRQEKFVIQKSTPYLSRSQLAQLIAIQPITKLSSSKSIALRLQVHAYIVHVSEVLRFPIKTIGTAMILYHQFLLFNAMAGDFRLDDVAAACLFVSCKMMDTVKNLRSILSTARSLKSGSVVDPLSAAVDDQRRRVINLERLILETKAFDFRIRHPQAFIIKFARKLKLCKEIAQAAWRITEDSYLTMAPLLFVPHTIALAALSLAQRITTGNWISIPSHIYLSDSKDVDGVLCELLDLYIHHPSASSIASGLPSPYSPLEVSPHGIDFMVLQIEVNKRKRKTDEPDTQPSTSMSLRDPTISSIGTVRYIIESPKNVRDRLKQMRRNPLDV